DSAASWSRHVADLAASVSLITHLPVFLRHPIGATDAAQTVRQRLASREADFLMLISRSVFGDKREPYWSLLRHCGCEFGDLDRLVRTESLEGALRRLAESGVYLTLDEFKGRAPIRRGSMTLSMTSAGVIGSAG